MRPLQDRRRFLASMGAAGSLAVAGCLGIGESDENELTPVDSSYDLAVEHDLESWDRYDPDWEPPETSPAEAEFRTETLVENLEIPWDMSFADDGELYF